MLCPQASLFHSIKGAKKDGNKPSSYGSENNMGEEGMDSPQAIKVLDAKVHESWQGLKERNPEDIILSSLDLI